MLRAQAQLRLDQTELEALEARSGDQEVAKVQEVQGGHGLEHPQLVDEQLLDLGHARKAAQGHSDAALVHRVVAEEGQHRVELVQDLLEPELVGLVHHDEQHLVVGGPAVGEALGRLAREELIELQVLRVFDGGVGFRHGGSRARNPKLTAPGLGRASVE